MNLPNKEIFFSKYHSLEGKEKEFDELGYKWSDMEKIYYDYISRRDSLLVAADAVTNILSVRDKVHSVRKRIKHPEHLIEKIIRKSLFSRCKFADINNYLEVITDLIGIRILHLYKEDWLDIHRSINDSWQPYEQPTANIKRGDKEDIFLKNGCIIEEHDYGYRSVHYLIIFNVTNEINSIIEIQVRTLFEEAWSEIDHESRYPYDANDPILGSFLQTFSGIVGNADSMGSFVKFLKSQLYKKEEATFGKGEASGNNENMIETIELTSTEELQVAEQKLKSIYNNLNDGGYNNFYIQNFAVSEFKNFPLEKLSLVSKELQMNLGKSIVEIAPSNANSGSYQAREFLNGLINSENKYPVSFVKGIFLSSLRRYKYLWICSEYFEIAFELTIRLNPEEGLDIIDTAIKELSDDNIEIFHGGKKCDEIIYMIDQYFMSEQCGLLKTNLEQLVFVLRALRVKDL